MRRKEAESLCPQAIVLEADPCAEASAFEPVTRAVEEVVPRVEVAEAGLLYVPTSGAVRWYGGEEPLARAVLTSAREAGAPHARIGVAGGPFLARLAARAAPRADPVRVLDPSDGSFLAGLTVGVLDDPDLAASLRWLGIEKLGAFAALPRDAVTARFGARGLAAHRLACGEDRLPAPRVPLTDLVFADSYDPPLISLEATAFAARALAARVVAALAELGTNTYRVEIEAQAEDGTVRCRTWRAADPFDDVALAERIRWQISAWADGPGLTGGLFRLAVTPFDLSSAGRQLALGDGRSAAEAARALSRVQAMLGPDAVLQARLDGGRDIAERVRWYRWSEAAPPPRRDPTLPWPGRIPPPAPSLVPPETTPLHVECDDGIPVRVRLGARWEPVLSWAGPWRRHERWWTGGDAPAPAAYYQLVTAVGALLATARDGRFYVSGVYD
jgi:protein ImuB